MIILINTTAKKWVKMTNNKGLQLNLGKPLRQLKKPQGSLRNLKEYLGNPKEPKRPNYLVKSVMVQVMDRPLLLVKVA